MAERKGDVLRAWLRSADSLSDSAIRRGSSQVKTSFSRSRAKLVSVTCCDQRFDLGLDLVSGFLAAIAHFSCPVICVNDNLRASNNNFN